jgi:alkylated DNA repair dioxygenase AlkB
VKKNDCEEEDVSVSQTKMKPFDIKQDGSGFKLKPSLFAKNKEKRKEMKQESSGKGIELRPGMVHLKGYILLNDQIKIVKVCRELGLGEGGFYQPCYEDGTKLHFIMMCLGRNWDPQTRRYGQQRLSDGSFPPQIPNELLTLVHFAINDSHSLTKPSNSEPLPPISPDICIVKFYDRNGRLGLHQASILYCNIHLLL